MISWVAGISLLVLGFFIGYELKGQESRPPAERLGLRHYVLGVVIVAAPYVILNWLLQHALRLLGF